MKAVALVDPRYIHSIPTCRLIVQAEHQSWLNKVTITEGKRQRRNEFRTRTYIHVSPDWHQFSTQQRNWITLPQGQCTIGLSSWKPRSLPQAVTRQHGPIPQTFSRGGIMNYIHRVSVFVKTMFTSFPILGYAFSLLHKHSRNEQQSDR